MNRDLQLWDEKVTLNHLVTAKDQSQNFDFKTSSDPTAPGYPFVNFSAIYRGPSSPRSSFRLKCEAHGLDDNGTIYL